MDRNRYGAALVLILVASGGLLAIDKIDPRLAQVHKAYVVAEDELGDDKPVAQCISDHLSKALPLTVVDKKDDADVVLKVKAHIPSATSRAMLGAMGGSPSAHLTAELPDGTHLWDDGGKYRRANMTGNAIKSSEIGNSIECGLADDLLDHLRNAMRKARDGK